MWSNKTEDLNLSVFNMITGINEWNQWWNNDKCRCECKKCHVYEKVMFGMLLYVAVKMEKI